MSEIGGGREKCSASPFRRRGIQCGCQRERRRKNEQKSSERRGEKPALVAVDSGVKGFLPMLNSGGLASNHSKREEKYKRARQGKEGKYGSSLGRLRGKGWGMRGSKRKGADSPKDYAAPDSSIGVN